MDYLRYLLLIMILISSTSIGWIISRKYIDRLNELKSLDNIINIIQNKIKFTKRPLTEIFEDTSLINENQNISNILMKVSEKIKCKKTNQAFLETIEEEINNVNLKKEDLNIIKLLGNILGKTDVNGQISELEQIKVLINKQIVNAENEKNKNCKLYKSMGTILGLGLMILLF